MKIDKVLAIDVETTGFSKGDSPEKNHQILAIGLIVADSNLNPVDEFYCEIKWNGTSHWTQSAQNIHGLSKEYLDSNGIEEEEAVVKIAEFILKHYDPDEAIIFLGHNPRGFDVKFLNKLMDKYDMQLKIAHRTIDSFSVGFTCLGANDSNELFSYFYERSDIHNALDDARMALGVCRKIKKIMKKVLK